LAQQAHPAPVNGVKSEHYAFDLERALLPEDPATAFSPPANIDQVKPTLLTKVSNSVQKIIDSPTWATVEELMIAPSAGGNEDVEPIFTLGPDNSKASSYPSAFT
jgi:hypothetical protein